MPIDLLSEIHSNTSVDSGDWASFRAEVTGMYLLSGQNSEVGRQHLLREYNRNINERYKNVVKETQVLTQNVKFSRNIVNENANILITHKTHL